MIHIYFVPQLRNLCNIATAILVAVWLSALFSTSFCIDALHRSNLLPGRTVIIIISHCTSWDYHNIFHFAVQLNLIVIHFNHLKVVLNVNAILYWFQYTYCEFSPSPFTFLFHLFICLPGMVICRYYLWRSTKVLTRRNLTFRIIKPARVVRTRRCIRVNFGGVGVFVHKNFLDVLIDVIEVN